MDIQLYADSAILEAERDTVNITLRKVDLGLLVSQINTVELIQAIVDNDGYSDIVEYISQAEKDKAEEDLL